MTLNKYLVTNWQRSQMIQDEALGLAHSHGLFAYRSFRPRLLVSLIVMVTRSTFTIPLHKATMATIVMITTLGASCTSNGNRLDYGIVDEHSGYVPARIAVLNCQPWPEGARYKNLPLTNVQAAISQELCSRFDDFVINGFKDQPYMRGFSPKWVKTLTEKMGKSALLNNLPKLWAHRAEDCNKCLNAPSFYDASLEDRKDWRLWLSNVSKAVRNADAVLLPFVTYAYERRFVDRGLFVSKRAAGVTLFLVDTDQGYLLWSGHRQSFSVNQEIENQKVANAVAYPAWTAVYERLLVEDVWKEFPGRQTYR